MNERVAQWLPVAMRVGHTHPTKRDTDLSSFPLNDRSMKLVPEKDSATSEAQTGVPLDDPEGTGQPKGEDSMQYGRVTTRCSLPPLHIHCHCCPRGLRTSQEIQHLGGMGLGDDSPLLNTYYVPHKILDTSYFLMPTTTLKSDGDSSILEMKKLGS